MNNRINHRSETCSACNQTFNGNDHAQGLEHVSCFERVAQAQAFNATLNHKVVPPNVMPVEKSRHVFMIEKDGKYYRNFASGFVSWTKIDDGQVFQKKSGASRAANLSGGTLVEFELCRVKIPSPVTKTNICGKSGYWCHNTCQRHGGCMYVGGKSGNSIDAANFKKLVDEGQELRKAFDLATMNFRIWGPGH